MSRQYVHRLFAAGVLLKGVDGLLETAIASQENESKKSSITSRAGI